MGFSRQEYCSGLLCPPTGDLLTQELNSCLKSPALAGGFFTINATWEALSQSLSSNICLDGSSYEISLPNLESESEVAQSCPTLCDPMDCSLPGFSVHGIFQARLLEWLAISFSKKDKAKVSEVAQLRPTLCDPMDCSLPGFSVHGIFQARVWSGLPFPSPGDLPDPGIKPRSSALQADSLPSKPPGKQYSVI